MEWSSVKVPRGILEDLRELRGRTRKPNWQIIVEAVSFYKTALTSGAHLSISSKTDKIAYYIMLLSKSAALYQTNPSRESLERFNKVIEKIEKRLKISCTELKVTSEKIVKDPSGRNIHTFNMALKSCIIKLISLLS